MQGDQARLDRLQSTKLFIQLFKAKLFKPQGLPAALDTLYRQLGIQPVMARSRALINEQAKRLIDTVLIPQYQARRLRLTQKQKALWNAIGPNQALEASRGSYQRPQLPQQEVDDPIQQQGDGVGDGEGDGEGGGEGGGEGDGVDEGVGDGGEFGRDRRARRGGGRRRGRLPGLARFRNRNPERQRTDAVFSRLSGSKLNADRFFPSAMGVLNAPPVVDTKILPSGFNIFAKPPVVSADVLRNQQMYKGKQILGTFLTQQTNKIGSKLQMFPQWSIRLAQNKQNIQNRQMALRKVQAKLQNQQEPTMVSLSATNPKIMWDQNRKSWTGPGIVGRVLQSNSTQLSDKVIKKVNMSRSLMNQMADDDMIKKNVPQMIQILSASTQQLSDSGFGPKKPGGMPLYVGRWIDPVSGSVRLFPQATQKYVNPLSRNQKLAYYQARIMNKWNQYVQQTQSYLKLRNVSNQQYTQKKKNQLVNSIKPRRIMKTSWSNLLNQMQFAAIGQFYGSPEKQFVWQDINSQQALIAYRNAKEANNWNQIVAYLMPLFQANLRTLPIGADKPTVNFRIKCMNYVTNLLDPQFNIQKRAVSQFAKIIAIPQNVNAGQWQKIVDNYNKIQTTLATNLSQKRLISDLSSVKTPANLKQSQSFLLLAPRAFEDIAGGRAIAGMQGMNQGQIRRLMPKTKLMKIPDGISSTLRGLIIRGGPGQRQIPLWIEIGQNLERNGNLNYFTLADQVNRIMNQRDGMAAE